MSELLLFSVCVCMYVLVLLLDRNGGDPSSLTENAVGEMVVTIATTVVSMIQFPCSLKSRRAYLQLLWHFAKCCAARFGAYAVRSHILVSVFFYSC